jgi:hypothetical protein
MDVTQLAALRLDLLEWVEAACTEENSRPDLTLWAPEQSLAARLLALAAVGTDVLLPWVCHGWPIDTSTMALVVAATKVAERATPYNGEPSWLHTERQTAIKLLLMNMAGSVLWPLEPLPVVPASAPAPALEQWLCRRPWLATPGLVSAATVEALSMRAADLHCGVAFRLLMRQDFHAAAIARWIAVIRSPGTDEFLNQVLAELADRSRLNRELGIHVRLVRRLQGATLGAGDQPGAQLADVEPAAVFNTT